MKSIIFLTGVRFEVGVGRGGGGGGAGGGGIKLVRITLET